MLSKKYISIFEDSRTSTGLVRIEELNFDNLTLIECIVSMRSKISEKEAREKPPLLSIILETFHSRVFRIIFSVFTVFLTVFVFFALSSSFYSGDAGIVSSMTWDMQQGKFYSWYFYGQDYFGNLEPFVLAFLTLFSGSSFLSLSFWEMFFYAVSLAFFFLTQNKIPQLAVPVVTWIMFLTTRYFEYIWHPQGFAFILMILAFHFWLSEKIWVREISFSPAWIFVPSFFAGISLWHNPMYFIVLPIFLIIALVQFYKKELQMSFKWFLALISGFLLGLIPFIFAGFETSWRNLSWFFISSDSSRTFLNKIFFNIKYYFSELAIYYLNLNDAPKVDHSFGSYLRLLAFLFGNIQNIFAFLTSLLFIISMIFGLFRIKKYLPTFLFLLFLITVLLLRSLPENIGLLNAVRYSMAFHALYTFSAIRILFDLSSEKEIFKNFGARFVFLPKLVSHLLVIVLVFLTFFGLSNLASFYRNRYKGQQPYEIAYSEITNKHKVKYLYCFNYYEFCGQLAYLSRINKNPLVIQIFDKSGDINGYRNIPTMSKVDEAYARGEQVFSFVQSEFLSPKHNIVETYTLRGTLKYYLIDSSYKN